MKNDIELYLAREGKLTKRLQTSSVIIWTEWSFAHQSAGVWLKQAAPTRRSSWHK